MAKFKYELGSKVRDRISGYEGIITSRTEWLYGCLRYMVQSQALKDGKPIDSIGCDEEALELIEPVKAQETKATGGPHDEPSRPSDPQR